MDPTWLLGQLITQWLLWLVLTAICGLSGGLLECFASANGPVRPVLAYRLTRSALLCLCCIFLCLFAVAAVYSAIDFFRPAIERVVAELPAS